MTNINSPSNLQGDRLELVVDRYAGAAHLPRSATTKTAGPNTTPAGDEGVATHYQGERFLEPSTIGSPIADTPDGVVVIAGIRRYATTLAAAITSTTATSATFASATGMPATQYVATIDSEDILVTAGFGTTAVTIVRGYNGTTAATHLISAAVTATVAYGVNVTGAGELLVSGTVTATGGATETTLGATNTEIGALTETAPATDTASSGLNGRLQRIAQRLTSIIALLPTALGAGGGLKVDGSGTALPVSAASLPLPSGAATAAKQPALGTAGTASGDVITVQGIASMTPVLVTPTAPNSEGTAVASGAYTTDQTQPDQTNLYAHGILATLDMTNAGTGSVTLEIDFKDPASGKYIALLTGAAVTSNSTNLYSVYPGAANTTNVSANGQLPKTWRIKVVANNANSATYSVGYALLG